MTCFYGPLSQTISGTGVAFYSWGFKWGFNSGLAKIMAHLQANDNLRLKEPAVVRSLRADCDQRVDCAAGGDYTRVFIRSWEYHTGGPWGWGGMWKVHTLGRVDQPCVDEKVEVSSTGPLKDPESEPALVGIQIPDQLGEQKLWMVRIDQSAYETEQCCSYTECKRNALYQAVILGDKGRVEYVPMFACNRHIHDDAKRFGFDVPED